MYGDQPDTSPTAHDHPWQRVLAVVLRGAVTEERETPEGETYRVTRYGLGFDSWRGMLKHRVIAAMPATITLFIGWKRRNTADGFPAPTSASLIERRKGDKDKGKVLYYYHYTEFNTFGPDYKVKPDEVPAR